MTKRLPLLAAILVAVSLGLAACGDDDEDTTTETGATGTESGMETLSLTGEETALTLDAGTARVLQQNDVEVAPVDPAGPSGKAIAFPITGGEVEAESLAGTVEHSGGLAFSAGGTEVEVTDFVADTAAGTLTATTGGSELPLLELDLANLERTMDGETIVASGIEGTLTQEAADALNEAFGVNLFEEGLTVGELEVRATA